MLHGWLEALFLEDVKGLDRDPVFYEELLEEIESYDLHAQIYFSLKRARLMRGMPSFFIQSLKNGYEQTVNLNFLMKAELDRVLDHLEERAIETIPLKGVYFAEVFYGHFGARSTSDLDLLIHKENLQQAKKCLHDLGFETAEPELPGHFHSSFSKPGPGEIPITVELHWHILKENTATFNVQKIWNRAEPFKSYQSIYSLSSRDVFYFMVLHAWRHNLDSTRHFLDLIQVIQTLKTTIDYRALLEEAREDLTQKRVARTLSILYYEFPFLETIVPFPYKVSRWYWSGRGAVKTSRTKVKTLLDFMDYQFLSYDLPTHCLKEMVNWVWEEKLFKNKIKKPKRGRSLDQ